MLNLQDIATKRFGSLMIHDSEYVKLNHNLFILIDVMVC